MRLFSDDTAPYLTTESEDDSSALQNDINTLLAWETRWDMDFNNSICQVIHVTGPKKTVKTAYILHGQVLESVPCARYLGVDISSGLTWKSHVDRVNANVNRTLGFIRRIIKTKMSKVRDATYNSLEYALAVRDPHTRVRISQIEHVQQRAARWTVSNFDRLASVSEMVQHLGWRSLEQRRADAVFACFTRLYMVWLPYPSRTTYIT